MSTDPRRRINEGISRSRLELEVKRGAIPGVTILICFAIFVLIAGYIVSHVSKSALSGTYQAQFQLSDATGVVPGVDEVRFKGVPVGTITKVQTKGERPVVTVKIQKKYHRLYRDVRAQLRPSTALQDMFLDITSRGTPKAGVLPDDQPVPSYRTQIPVNISDVLDVFQPSVRMRLRTVLDDLGNGLQDRGRTLRQIFVEATPFIQSAGRLAAQLRERAPLVRRLVHNTRVLTAELGDRQQQLRTLVSEGASTLGTLQAGSADLNATLRELPPTLDSVQSSFAAVRTVLPPVDDAVRSLEPVVSRLSGSLVSLRRLGDTASPAVRSLQEPVQRLVPLTDALKPLSTDLSTAIERLLPQTHTVDKVTKDLAGCKKGIQGFFQWNASISKFGDARGPVPRGNVVLGAQSSSLVNDPNEFAPQACTPGKVIGGRVPTAKDMH